MPFLPMFPLKMVVFPNENVNLHIFEPRYRQLIQECKADGITFGMPAFIDKKISGVGTELELIEIAKTNPDGAMDIRTKGLRRFRVINFQRMAPGRLYPGAEVEYLTSENEEGNAADYQEIFEKTQELFNMMEVGKPVPKDDWHTFRFGHLVGFSIGQKNELLAMNDELERQAFMLDHLRHLIPLVREAEQTKKLAQLNGHYRNYKAPI